MKYELMNSGVNTHGRWRQVYFILALWGAISLWPLAAGAADICSSIQDSTNVDVGAITVPPGVAVGASITGDKTFSRVDFATCWGDGGDIGGVLYGVGKYVGDYNGRATFQTNISGIGVQFGADLSATSNFGRSIPTASGWAGQGQTQIMDLISISGEMLTFGVAPKLNLIKIASTVGSGTLSGKAGEAQVATSARAQISVYLGGAVTSSGCSVTGGQTLNITLNDAHKADLPAVGSVWGESDEKEISLSCNAGTNVNITFSGAQATDTDDTSVLQNNGSAKGVGVQLMDLHNGDTPIPLNEKIAAVTNSGTTANIPIAARYIRTGDLTAGSVEASATWTLDYE
ncbi:TPA: type 1 fimbrial protein [Klebsiella pneumoniae]|uniref:fimbrial protein n=1 Tax=Klebsiella pneumoniae TaxID=573 RepID=UPI000B2D6136|nr:fimbrial protein [Klebsiella pneumoniae]MCI7951838.1 type 1 fimbrial protein [Klebsiella pneumoniae]MDU4371898.1 fimbrial protein [Klebsiella pneumoniae]MDW5940734.1 fimbrial protein [Klebsiella pneumoniae]MDW6114971.1 fimbrial protein [Klebsiella pneumoniae]HBQ8098965.1 type 1 fimbrial protein [Klebsiella pneumoniae]